MKQIFQIETFIDLNQVSHIIKAAREKKGNKSQVASKIGISSQLLGQYEQGLKKPKAEFYLKWKSVFNEDLLEMTETNVSREAKKEYTPTSTGEGNMTDIQEKQLTSRTLADLAESNKILAESNKSLARSHEKLVIMMQAKNTAIADYDQRTLVETVATVIGIRSLLIDVVAKVNKEQPAQVLMNLNKKVKDELTRLVEHKDNEAVASM